MQAENFEHKTNIGRKMRVQGLIIGEDINIELRVDGEVNFEFHSEKAREKIDSMSELDKLKFAISVKAKEERDKKNASDE